LSGIHREQVKTYRSFLSPLGADLLWEAALVDAVFYSLTAKRERPREVVPPLGQISC
jgi:hypothetical protein